MKCVGGIQFFEVVRKNLDSDDIKTINYGSAQHASTTAKWNYTKQYKKMGNKEYVNKVTITSITYTPDFNTIEVVVNERFDENSIEYKTTVAHELKHADDYVKYGKDGVCFNIKENLKADLENEINNGLQDYKKRARKIGISLANNDDTIKKGILRTVNNQIGILDIVDDRIKKQYDVTVSLEVRAMEAENTLIPNYVQNYHSNSNAKITNHATNQPGDKTYWDVFGGKCANTYSIYKDDAEFKRLLEENNELLKKYGEAYLYFKHVGEEKTGGENDVSDETIETGINSFVQLFGAAAAVMHEVNSSKKKKPASAQPSGSKYCWCGKRIGHLSNHAKQQ